MGFQTAAALFAFPLALILVSIFLQGGNTQGSPNTSVSFCNQSNCAPVGSSTVITCSNLLTPCKILPGCSNPPAPAWCFPWPLSLVPGNGGTWLDAGATVVLTSTQFNSGLTPSTAVFNFNSIGPAGWIVVLFIAVGIAVISSITILNSGMGAEGVHILYMAGGLLGVWGLLVAFDGFLSGNANSLFATMNAMGATGSFPFGTSLFIICTLLWTAGTFAATSRGA